MVLVRASMAGHSRSHVYSSSAAFHIIKLASSARSPDHAAHACPLPVHAAGRSAGGRASAARVSACLLLPEPASRASRPRSAKTTVVEATCHLLVAQPDSQLLQPRVACPLLRFWHSKSSFESIFSTRTWDHTPPCLLLILSVFCGFIFSVSEFRTLSKLSPWNTTLNHTYSL